MTLRVDIKPELLRWAMERSGVDSAVLYSRFSKLGAWLDRSVKPTFKQAEAFARATHTPFGFLLLPAPPEEPLPIPDFRNVANNRIAHPSANLLDHLPLSATAVLVSGISVGLVRKICGYFWEQ